MAAFTCLTMSLRRHSECRLPGLRARLPVAMIWLVEGDIRSQRRNLSCSAKRFDSYLEILAAGQPEKLY